MLYSYLVRKTDMYKSTFINIRFLTKVRILSFTSYCNLDCKLLLNKSTETVGPARMGNVQTHLTFKKIYNINNN